MGFLSGMSKAEKKTEAARSDRLAAGEERDARDHRRKAAQHRKSLSRGSSDPSADRYMIRHHEASAHTQESNARALRDSAKNLRKWWL